MLIAIICVCTGCKLVRVLVLPRSQLVVWSVQVLRLHSHFLSNIRRHLLLGEVCCDYFALYYVPYLCALLFVQSVKFARREISGLLAMATEFAAMFDLFHLHAARVIRAYATVMY